MMRSAERGAPIGAPRIPGLFPEGWPGLEEHFVVLRSGLRARVVAAGPPVGPPLVLVHGWGCSAYMYRRHLAMLGAAGWRVFAPDLKGHGLSDKPTAPGTYTTAAMRDHVLEVLDALGIACAPLVGHSMGGALVTHVALAAPERVARVIALSPVGFGRVTAARLGRFVSPYAAAPLARALATPMSVGFLLRLLRGLPWPMLPQDAWQYWAPTRLPGFAEAAWALLHEFRWSAFTDEELGALRVPLLVLAGTGDWLVRFTQAAELACRRHGAELVLVRGAGHLTPEEVPEAVVGEIERFLRQPHVAPGPGK